MSIEYVVNIWQCVNGELRASVPDTERENEAYRALRAATSDYGDVVSGATTTYWPNWYAFMAEFSKGFPELVFEVYARDCDDPEGDERWFFRDGKFQCADPVVVTEWPEFDEAELELY